MTRSSNLQVKTLRCTTDCETREKRQGRRACTSRLHAARQAAEVESSSRLSSLHGHDFTPPATALSFDARTSWTGHTASSSKSLGLAKSEVNSKTWPITTSPLNYRISVLRVQIDSQQSRANRSPNYRLMPASLSSPTATSPITTSTLNPHVNIEYKQCTVASSSRKVTSHKGRTSHRRTAEAREKRDEENYKRRVE